MPTKACRLIVRNIPFDVSGDELKEMFQEYGRIMDFHVPEGKKKGEKTKNAGFAFLTFRSPMKAVEVVAKSSKLEIKIGDRPLVVDWALPKSMYQEKSVQPAKSSPKEETKVEKEDDGSDVEMQVSDHSDAEDENHADDDGDDDAEEEGDDNDANDDDEQVEEKSEGFQDAKKVKTEKAASSRDVGERRTVFVRNLPFTSTEEQIKECFASFGTIRRVSMVHRKMFGDYESFKGTAFIEFRNSDDALKTVQKADVSVDDLPVKLQRLIRKGKNVSETAKQLALEGVGGIWMDGRLLSVTLAIGSQDAKKMEEQLAEQRNEKDRRNLWLAEEGRKNLFNPVLHI
jgi:nucleolar protein 4